MSSKKARRLLALDAKANAKGLGVEKRRGAGVRKSGPGMRQTEKGRPEPPIDTKVTSRASLDVGAGQHRSQDGLRVVAPAQVGGTAGGGRHGMRETTTNSSDTNNSAISSLLYAPFDDVNESFPWLEDDVVAARRAGGASLRTSVDGIVRSLLKTNHRYSKTSTSSSAVVDKMKEKTILLENPVGQKSRNNRLGAFYTPGGVRLASRKVLKGLVGDKVTYEDALMLHDLWKAYRDEVLGEPTGSKQEEMERVWGLERCGAMVEVVWRREGSVRSIKGIVVEASERCLHVLEESGKLRVVDTHAKGCEVRMEVGHGRMATFIQ